MGYDRDSQTYMRHAQSVHNRLFYLISYYSTPSNLAGLLKPKEKPSAAAGAENSGQRSRRRSQGKQKSGATRTIILTLILVALGAATMLTNTGDPTKEIVTPSGKTITVRADMSKEEIDSIIKMNGY